MLYFVIFFSRLVPLNPADQTLEKRRTNWTLRQAEPEEEVKKKLQSWLSGARVGFGTQGDIWLRVKTVLKSHFGVGEFTTHFRTCFTGGKGF